MKTRLPYFFVLLIIAFSCFKKNDQGPNPERTFIIKGEEGDDSWNFTERPDGEGKWLGSGCAVQSYNMITNENGIRDTRASFIRYYPDNTISKKTRTDSTTGISSNNYLAFQYNNGLISSIHKYKDIAKDTLLPIVYTLAYQGKKLISSRKHIKIRTSGGVDSTFDGFIVEQRNTTYTTNTVSIMNFLSTTGTVKTSKGTRPIDHYDPLDKISINLLNNSLGKPSKVVKSIWSNNIYTFSEGYTCTYNGNGLLESISSIDAANVPTLLKKYYWDNTKSLNKEMSSFFTSEAPFNEHYKLYPFELYRTIMDTISNMPLKVEEYQHGNLINTISYEGVFEAEKLVKLVVTHSSGKKEEYTYSYTCN